MYQFPFFQVHNQCTYHCRSAIFFHQKKLSLIKGPKEPNFGNAYIFAQAYLIDYSVINKIASFIECLRAPFIVSLRSIHENTSIPLTLHLGRDCRPVNKQKKARLNASIQTDLFYLFIVLVVSRKLFNDSSNLT